MSAFLRKYAVGSGADIWIPIIKRGVVDFAVSADWTPAAGDVKISIDGAAAANIATLPVALTMGNTAGWKFVFSNAELTGKTMLVTVADSATKAVEDQAFVIETYGHASAMYPTDLSAAVLPVKLADTAHGGPATTLQLGSTSSTPAILFSNSGGNAVKITGSYTGGGSAANAAILLQHTGVGAPIIAFDGEDDVTTINTSGAITAPINNLGAGSITAAAIGTGAIDADAISPDAVTEIQSGLATAANLATVAGYIDTEIGTIITMLGDIPTVAEFEARTLLAADYTIVSDLGVVQTADHTAAIADLPTNAELATALGTADDAVLAAIAALNNLSSAQAQTAAAAALTAYDPPTNAEMEARTLVSAGYATAAALSTAQGNITTILGTTTKVETMLVLDGAVYQWTVNALELGPSGSGASAAAIADAVWDEAIADHDTAGTFGETNQTSGSGDTVVIGPVAAEVSEASIASSTGGTKYPLTLFQHTAASVVTAVTDGDGTPVTMTGHAFKVVVHQTDGTVIREFNSTDEAAQFTLANSGAVGGTNDQLTVDFLTADTATAGVYQWELRNTTLGVVLLSGRFEVNTAPNP